MSKNPPVLAVETVSPSYEALLGKSAWNRLRPEIRQRFDVTQKSKSVVYEGVMEEVFLSKAGKVFAQLCRLIGTPLALYSGSNVPITVKVYPDKKTGGITWDRFYYFQHKKVNRVKSTKLIQQNLKLVEIVGYGFGMHLKATEEEGGLHFTSQRFFCQIANIKIPIPHILSPGTTKVSQIALDKENFQFNLTVEHPLLGCVFKQRGIFKEQR